MILVGAMYGKSASDFTVDTVLTAKRNWCSSFTVRTTVTKIVVIKKRVTKRNTE